MIHTCFTLKATGSVLLHLQCEGSTEHRKLGLSVRTSSPAWSANTSATFRVSGRDRSGPGLDMVPLPSPILLQGKDVEGGVNRLVGMLSTGRIITTTGSQVQRQTLLGQKRGLLVWQTQLSFPAFQWWLTGLSRVQWWSAGRTGDAGGAQPSLDETTHQKKRVFSKIWRMPGDCGRPCETNHPENMGCFLFTQQTWKPGALQSLSRGGAVNWPIDTSMCRFAWLQNTMWLLRAHWQVC